MYSILIVDDEKREREGIVRLISRYGFELETVQAPNGEAALELMEKRQFDILLTDIKMPFMDGMQLIKEVRKKGWNPICIIFSAYGEFEYARDAISLGVSEYLLKPIQLDVFQNLFHKVIANCREKEEQEKKEQEIHREYSEILNYRRQKALLAFLDGEQCETVFEELKFEKKNCVPILVSAYSNFFSMEWENYQMDIYRIFGEEILILNKDENQLFLLQFVDKTGVSQKNLGKQYEEFLEITRQKYQTEVFMIVGGCADGLETLKKEYEEIRDQLDYQFFVSESTIVMQNRMYFEKREQDMLPLYFERIFNDARLGDFPGMKKEFRKVFDYISSHTGFSSIYIKYTFTDAIRKIWEYTGAENNLIVYAEKIYDARSFEELERMVNSLLDEMLEKRREDLKENRLVRMTKEMIGERYGECSLGVSAIADELHVAAAYLSSLFKMETGENLNKYITRFRMEKSKSMLRQTNIKVGDIAAQVGYSNASYFISVFRNHEGCSPVQYRERIAEHEESN